MRKNKNVLGDLEFAIPFISKRNISRLQKKVTPFIERRDINSVDDYREKTTHYNNNNDVNTNENISEIIEEDSSNYNQKKASDKKVNSIIEHMKKDDEYSYGDDYIIHEGEEDLGLALAKAVYGSRINNKQEEKNDDNFLLSHYGIKAANKSNKEPIVNVKEDDYEPSYSSTPIEKDVHNNHTEEDNYNPFGINIKKEEPIETVYEENVIEKVEIKETYKEEIEEIKDNGYSIAIHNIRENKKEEEIITSNDENDDEYLFSKKPFEFNMGYGSFKKYDRNDHFPKPNAVKDNNERVYKVETTKNNNENILNHSKEENTNPFENLIPTQNNINSNSDEPAPIENNYNSLEDKYEEIFAATPMIIEENENYINEYDSEKDLYRSQEIGEIISKEKIEKSENEYLHEKEQFEKKEDSVEPNKNIYVQKNTFKKKFSVLEHIQSNFDTEYVDKNYRAPSVELLKKSVPVDDEAILEAIRITALQLENTLLDFNVEAKVTGVSRGPVVTRYELELSSGTRVSKIVSLTDNIALALASESVRIIAPIPGRSVIGIEIPNRVRTAVFLRDVLESSDFKNTKQDIPFVLGKGIYGNNIVTDMAEAPHLLVAGTTGSGKSVCLSTIILSLLFKFRPDELKFIFIDKKRVELSIYNGIPHLMSPVISDEKKATVVLRYIVDIMERRYERMEKFFVRNVKAYNEKVKQLIKIGETEFEGEPLEAFPYIILVIDELHNLMVVSSKEVEDLISRLAGMSRAVGIHLVIATQRPSADVVTGIIKANLPTRIAFQVPNKTNSRIIIDMAGAEQLLGKGDALFCSSGTQMPERTQGAFVSDNEVKRVVDYLSSQMPPMFDESLIASLERKDSDDKSSVQDDINEEELWDDAIDVVMMTGKASASFLQRKLKIGYNRAARIIDLMEQQDLVGPENGSKPREVYISDIAK